MKKGRFYGSQKRYFYLEDFYLKYGDKEGKARKCIDLSLGNGEQEVTLSEGSYHQGIAHVVRFRAQL